MEENLSDTVKSTNKTKRTAPSCCCTHDQEHKEEENHAGHSHDDVATGYRLFLPALISLVLLGVALLFDYGWKQAWFSGEVRWIWYGLAYIPVGFPVLRDAFLSARAGDLFSEFFLMGIATIGAFAIGEYPEAVAVMLFYAVGEIFQSLAVSKAKGSIKALLDQRPDEVTVLVDHVPQLIRAEKARIGDVLQLKPGEKLGLDGELLSASASFNTSALTGESRPDTKKQGDMVLAGMINLHTLAEVKVTAAYQDSKLSKILKLVQDATSKKAPTELFIRKFARIYTPIVALLAVGICLLPYFIVQDYQFTDWLYRALVFLVISCPCALVISIPLGYFGGIGAASRHGILVKGSNFLDTLAKTTHVVMDKTGTLTEGVFQVQDVVFNAGFDKEEILCLVQALEAKSTHPVATAIRQYVGEEKQRVVFEEVEELAGLGMRATVSDNRSLLVGNFKLMDKFGITYDIDLSTIVYTTIAVAFDGKFVGYLTIADRLKEDAKFAIERLHKLGVETTILSGDKENVVHDIAAKLNVKRSFGDLLPADKLAKVEALKKEKETVVFVGDGVNDAPVIAGSDVGMAMGGLGSDAAIETADVVIQDDRPARIGMAIQIGRQTKVIVWQNILMAFVVKGLVLFLGAWGVATMWEAVFADVGVALMAILNAIRIQRTKF
ncbi:heavy metal translocating P-type ATPase [Sphingobacterium sp. LRF_L2]|uniref:heavy metal translocating P-type ATPase n=1 Tax=Sphingobacterium sp. LRF_L2 TaxID=3369421 RepID=UPI003F62D922